MTKKQSIITLIISILVLAGCSAAPAPTATPVPTEPPATPTEAPIDDDDDKIVLTLPTYEDGSHEYYVELLQTALTAADYEVTIELTENLPQARAVQMVENGDLSLIWLIQSVERDELYTPVELGLTEGLIGHRILLIPEGENDAYATITTLDEFRELGKVGAFGDTWFDSKIWDYNELPYEGIEGEWRVIYGMLEKGDRGIDYFSRGFTEIQAEAERNPDLAIEENLMLIYDRDFRFYLSPDAAQYKDMIEDALNQATENGIVDELIRNYWSDDFEDLNFDGRVKIQLENPE